MTIQKKSLKSSTKPSSKPGMKPNKLTGNARKTKIASMSHIIYKY